MAKKLDGLCFKNMVDYGVRNLNINCKTINQLNVFPVPDGDTGTNMLTTISKGLVQVDDSVTQLSDVSKKFAKSIVFEARGNSGVIVSQFLKGFSETFSETDEADAKLFINALEKGVVCAYSAVANPVEGTMLTVVKDATAAVKGAYTDNQTIDDTVSEFIKHAKVSLENTPNLLDTLKEAGVVDSGGAGIVCLFEGMKKYLDGDSIEAPKTSDEKTAAVDYSVYNTDSIFEFGYCTEMLIQLLNNKAPFDYEDFKKTLNELGNSVVTTYDSDKVKVHIHSLTPGEVLNYCNQFGEFLTLKIENMTVQHTDLTKNILCSEVKNDGAFSVVAVAYDRTVQNLFLEMGADVVIYSEDGVSTKDYVEAFKKAGSKEIIVFPNGNDAILSAEQAKTLFKHANIHVLNTKDIAECYSSLPIIDFSETNIDTVINEINETIENIYVVSFIKRIMDDKNAPSFYALHRKEILGIGSALDEVALNTVKNTLDTLHKDIVTIFYDNTLSDEYIESLVEKIKNSAFSVDVYTIPTQTLPCALTISFE